MRDLLRSRPSVTEKYEFIDGEKVYHPVRKMCDWLGVSSSGFYAWRSRPISATAERREELEVIIRHIFDESDGTYGYRRIHAALTRMDVQVGPELVRGLMRKLDLVPCQPRPWRTTTIPADDALATPDLMNRDFTAHEPGRKLIGSGSRRESHPPAPTEPCVTVSRYTALATLITRNCGTSASGRTSPDIAV
jgi:hypothetical protein